MTSSHLNIASSSRGGIVPRAPYDDHDPRSGPNARNDLRSQLYELRLKGRRFMAFMSILLGDDEVLDEGATGNKREEGTGVRSGTDHDTMQPHGGKLAYPTTTLWLPENLKNRAVTLDYTDGVDFINHMKIVHREVLKFGPRATDVAKAFARMEFHRAYLALFKIEYVREALKALVEGMETKLPPMDPLLPNILDTSVGFVPSASYILEPRPLRVGSDADDYQLQLRNKFYDLKQFHIFLSILLGEDHDSLQPHRASTTTVWLPEYLKKRDAILNSSASQCWEQLMRLFNEVMKYGARTTDVAKAFARMKIEDVELLLEYPEVLQTILQQFDSIARDNDTRELIQMFMPEVEIDPNIDIPLDALPEEFLPDVEPIDDDYINLSVFRYFGQM